MATHLMLLLVLAYSAGAVRGFYLPGVAPADFRKVPALFFSCSRPLYRALP